MIEGIHDVVDQKSSNWFSKMNYKINKMSHILFVVKLNIYTWALQWFLYKVVSTALNTSVLASPWKSLSVRNHNLLTQGLFVLVKMAPNVGPIVLC